jgi:hypothetical protein
VSKILAKLAEKEQVGIVLLGKQVSEGENYGICSQRRSFGSGSLSPDPDLNPIQIQGFDDKKLEKITVEKCLKFF